MNKHLILQTCFFHYNYIMWPYCLSRDCPISCVCRLQCHLQKPLQRRTLPQKSPLLNNISPSNVKYSFKITNHLLVTGYRLLKKLPKLEILSYSMPYCPQSQAQNPNKAANVMPQQQTPQWDVPLGVLMSKGPLRLVVPFIFH